MLHCVYCCLAFYLPKRCLQNVCTELFQWREGKATSPSSPYCELQAKQLVPDVGSLSKAGINPALHLSSVTFSP